jgi:hypothetical protein
LFAATVISFAAQNIPTFFGSPEETRRAGVCLVAKGTGEDLAVREFELQKIAGINLVTPRYQENGRGTHDMQLL